MEYLPREGYRRVLVIAFYVFLALLCAYVFIKFLFAPLLPFLLACAVAAVLQSPVRLITARTHLPRTPVAAALCVFCYAALFGLVFWLGSRIFFEFRSFLTSVPDEDSALFELLEKAMDFIKNISEKLPMFKNGEDWLLQISSDIDAIVADIVKNFASSAAAKLSDVVAKVAAAVPGVLLFLLVLVISSVYFTVDYPKITQFIASKLPRRALFAVSDAKRTMIKSALCGIKAYFMIMTITFFELLIGFAILGIPYAALLAAVTALIDILPVFGVGIVLFPYALCFFISGDIYRGIGLLILYLLVLVARQIQEPRIVGKLTGIYPPLMLVAIYVGLKLLGAPGLFLFPLALILAEQLFVSSKAISGQNGNKTRSTKDAPE